MGAVRRAHSAQRYVGRRCHLRRRIATCPEFNTRDTLSWQPMRSTGMARPGSIGGRIGGRLLWCVALAAVASQSVPPTPLHAASERGDVAEVRTLLAQYPLVEAVR